MRRTRLRLLEGAKIGRQADRVAADFASALRSSDVRRYDVPKRDLPSSVNSARIKVSVSSAQPGIAVRGAFVHDTRAVEIDVEVSPEFAKRDVDEVEAEVREKLHHEFVHSTQPMDKLRKTPPAARGDDVSAMRDYYLNPEEAEAHVAGLKANASERGVSFRKVLDDRLAKIRHFAIKRGSSPESVDGMLRRVRKDWSRRSR